MNSQTLLRSILNRWWFLLLCMLAGAALGAVSARGPQRYESSADLVMSLDLSRTGILTDIEADQLVTAVGDVILSKAVMTDAVEQLTAGESVTVEQFMSGASLERYNMTWTLRYQDANADFSNRAVEAWSQAAYRAVSAAQDAARQAGLLETQLIALSDCLSTYSLKLPLQAGCTSVDPSQLHEQAKETQLQLTKARLNAAGLTSALTLRPPEAPQPARRMTTGTGARALTGATGGLLLGLLLPLLWPAKHSAIDD